MGAGKHTWRSYLPYLVAWTVLNLVQAFSTELIHDEAYYWVYSQFPDWGYFDHPPGIAMCIWSGTLLTGGELGVRLISVLLSTATLAGLFYWIRPESNRLFFFFVFSIMLMHGAFLAVPDIPLIAAACGFVIVFDRYLRHDNWVNMLLLGAICASLLYAKYHGALLIACALLSQPKFLRRTSFWLMTSFALLLFVPHMLWQYAHDFVTFRYHLFERVNTGFSWSTPLEFGLGQIVIYGPLTSIVILASVRRWRIGGGMRRTALWIVAGVFGLFLMSTFRGRVEANWTAVALPALLFLSYKAIENDAWLRRLAWYSIWISVPLILLFRILLVVDITHAVKLKEVHGWDTWAEQITAAAGDRIPVFRNSYQFASKYMFYSGGALTFSCNDAAYKGNQFDYWPQLESAIQGQPVLLLSGHKTDSIWDRERDQVETVIQPFHNRTFEAFRSFNSVRIEIVDPPVEITANDLLSLKLRIFHDLDSAIMLDDPGLEIVTYLQEVNTDDYQWLSHGQPEVTLLPAGRDVYQTVTYSGELERGSYKYRVGLRWRDTGGKNSFLYHLNVIRPRR